VSAWSKSSTSPQGNASLIIHTRAGRGSRCDQRQPYHGRGRCYHPLRTTNEIHVSNSLFELRSALLLHRRFDARRRSRLSEVIPGDRGSTAADAGVRGVVHQNARATARARPLTVPEASPSASGVSGRSQAATSPKIRADRVAARGVRAPHAKLILLPAALTRQRAPAMREQPPTGPRAPS